MNIYLYIYIEYINGALASAMPGATKSTQLKPEYHL